MPIVTNPTYATGDTIEAAIVNTLRDNISLLDGRTGGDPAAAGKLLVSSGTLAGLWLAPGGNGLALVMVGGVPTWAEVGAAGLAAGSVGSSELASGAAVQNINSAPADLALASHK